MKKQQLTIIIVAACLLSISVGSFLAVKNARGSNNAGAIRGEQSAQTATGDNIDPRAQFMKMREELADTTALMGTVSGILRMEKSAQNPLTAEQANALLKILNQLRDEEKLTKAQARDYTTKIKNILTIEQRDTVAQLAERRRAGAAGTAGAAGAAGGTPRGGRTGGYGGAGGAPGGGAAFDPAALKDVNPYYRETTASGRFDGRETMGELVTLLEKSTGK